MQIHIKLYLHLNLLYLAGDKKEVSAYIDCDTN